MNQYGGRLWFIEEKGCRHTTARQNRLTQRNGNNCCLNTYTKAMIFKGMEF